MKATAVASSRRTQLPPRKFFAAAVNDGSSVTQSRLNTNRPAAVGSRGQKDVDDNCKIQ